MERELVANLDNTAIAANYLIGSHDILFVSFDTLRYDIAQECLQQGRTPNLAGVLPQQTWEKRHSPANFTYAAHHAFFAGFFPTPVAPGKHPRLFAVSFPGSETIDPNTCVFDTSDIVSGLASLGYRTICIGGVGFFNKMSPLGNVLPGLFAESHWNRAMGVTDAHSTENQVALAIEILDRLPKSQRVFLFINIAAIHQPNCIFLPGASSDSRLSHAAALEYVDRHLPPLFELLQRRSPVLCILCSDHGTAYGEDNYFGHRVSHPTIWDVPYAEFVLPKI